MNRSQAPRSPAQNDPPGRSRSGGNANVRKRGAAQPPPEAPKPGDDRGSARTSLVSSALGFVAAATFAGAAAWASGCHGEAPPGPSTEGRPQRVTLPQPPPIRPTSTAAARAPASSEGREANALPATEAPAPAATDARDPGKPYTGPLLGATVPQAPVYGSMEFSKHWLGYVRLGGKVPVDPKPIRGGNCAKGWYRLLDGGYVCGKSATTDMSNPQVRLGITAPSLDDVLPYKYAYNTAHGTPLYRSVPSKEEMARYEPYLESSKRRKKEQDREKADELYESAKDEMASADAPRPSVPDEAVAGAKPAPPDGAAAPPDQATAAEDKAAAVAAAASIGILAPAPAEEEPEKPWWQQADEKGKPLNVTLADLDKDADGTVAKRMVRGFFVAVDKTFGWNNRSWYKTTAGLVAPTDRMYIIKPPTSQGIDFPAGAKAVGFITSGSASKYQFDGGTREGGVPTHAGEMKSVSVAGPIARFSAFGLTGETHSHKTVIFRKTTEGWWMKGIDGTFTDVGAPPPDLAPGEKWIDVNLTRKTIVALEGDKPVYAALVSPGRRSKNDKKKDHPTKTGVFRIREKHVAVTMDGDGTVAGDLPYSIEDVPYVAYYDGSYALHGAFWHNNFGHEMSHGCVNLSPLDAKKFFFWSDPQLPRGWHGVWATSEHRGTTISIHE